MLDHARVALESSCCDDAHKLGLLAVRGARECGELEMFRILVAFPNAPHEGKNFRYRMVQHLKLSFTSPATSLNVSRIPQWDANARHDVGVLVYKVHLSRSNRFLDPLPSSQ